MIKIKLKCFLENSVNKPFIERESNRLGSQFIYTVIVVT